MEPRGQRLRVAAIIATCPSLATSPPERSQHLLVAQDQDVTSRAVRQPASIPTRIPARHPAANIAPRGRAGRLRTKASGVAAFQQETVRLTCKRPVSRAHLLQARVLGRGALRLPAVSVQLEISSGPHRVAAGLPGYQDEWLQPLRVAGHSTSERGTACSTCAGIGMRQARSALAASFCPKCPQCGANRQANCPSPRTAASIRRDKRKHDPAGPSLLSRRVPTPSLARN